MKIIFKNKFVLFFVGVMLVFSCTDVEESITNTGSIENLTVEGQIRNMYASLQLRNVFDARGYPFLWGDSGVDVFAAPRFDRVSSPIFRNNFTPTDSENLRMWQEHYFGLGAVNRAIETFETFRIQDSITLARTPGAQTIFRLERNSDIENREDLVNDLKAQARFIRAILNFNLVKAYENPVLILDSGGELITDISDLDISDRPNSNPTEFFRAIEEDLLFAENNLQTRSGTFTEATSLAASALLGKVYLQAAGCMRNNVYEGFSFTRRNANGELEDGALLSDTELYQMASDKLGEVIDSGVYRLLGNYGNIFDPQDEAANTEMIFQVAFTSNGVDTGSSYGDAYGVSGGVPNGGNRPVTPQYELIYSYFDHSLINLNRGGFDNNGNGIIDEVDLTTNCPSTTSTNPTNLGPEFFFPRTGLGLGRTDFLNVFSNRTYPLPISDQRFLVNIATFSVTDVNNSGNIEDIRKNQSVGAMGVYKYRKQLIASAADTNDQDFGFPYLRYADVLLLRAEAHANLNELTEATELLNMVRRRAYLIDPDEAGGTTSSDVAALNAVNSVHNLEYIKPYLGEDGSGNPVIISNSVQDDIVGVGSSSMVNANNKGLTFSVEPNIVIPVQNVGLPSFSRRYGLFGSSLLRVGNTGNPRIPPSGAIILDPDNLTRVINNNNERVNRVQTILPTAGLKVDIPATLSQDELMMHILRERRKELAFEGHRRDDLIRNGVAVLADVVSRRAGETSVYSVDPNVYRGGAVGADDISEDLFRVNGANTNPNFPVDFFQSINYRLPIPQQELNRNSLLKQNPGYPGS